MILAKAQAGTMRYLIAQGATPPGSIAASVYSPAGVLLGVALVPTAPTSKNLASIAIGQREGYATLTLSTGLTSPVIPGDILRVLDGQGLHSDCLCIGVNNLTIKIAEYGGSMTSVASCWKPEITIPLTGTHSPECGDGYRVSLTLTYTGRVDSDTLWYGVAPFPSMLEISPRDYVDYHPESGQQLMQVQGRSDWARVVLKGCEVVEIKLRGMERWANSIIAPTGHRRAVAAAIHRTLAPSYIPPSMSSDPQAWINDANAKFAEAIRDLLSGARYDATGVAGAALVQEPPARTSYKAL